MKNSNRKGQSVLQQFSFLLIVLFFAQSCSTDSPVENVIEAAIEDAMDPPVENAIDSNVDDTNDDTVDSEETETGDITFEEGFVLDTDKRLANLVLTQTDYNAFLEGQGDLKQVSEKAYEYLNDDFDFLIILSVEAVKPPDLFFGRSTGVQNAVEGLGSSTYNNSSAYGSAERLKSIIYMPRSEYIKSGPFLHEIAHTWGNNGFIPTTVSGHWGYASTAGQLGGFDELEELGGNRYQGKLNGSNGFGSFANGGNSIPYSNLELYLLGLISADALEPIQVAVNPVWESNDGIFTADAITTYTAADLITENGERIPSQTNSQKAFKALAVIISTEKLSQEKVAAINSDLENFSRASAPDDKWAGLQNFWSATQAKASFDFSVSQESIK